MKNKKILLLLIFALIVAGGFWWFKQHTVSASAPEAAEAAVSALVKTQPIAQQAMDSSLETFGDVVSGKLMSLSFPQAGQLILLSVQPGQQVHRGDTLALLVSDPNAQTAYVQALSAANFARAELQRAEELFGLKLLTQSQFESARKQWQDAQSMLQAQTKLGGASEQVSLLAPEDGVITALVAAQGDRLAAGAAVLQFGTTNSLRIQLGIEPTQQHLVRAGMKVSLATLQATSPVIAARISEVQKVVDPRTQLVNAIVLLRASTAIVAGMRVQGTIQLGQKQAWLAPRQAVLSDDKGDYVFQVTAGKAHRVTVVKLNETANQFGLEGEIDPKLPLVVLGNYELEDGMAVRESVK